MEKFIINKNSNCEFKFDFIDIEGNIILSSGGYTRKLMCLKGIESVRRNSQDNLKFFKKTNSVNEYYFNLKAFNGKNIGVSKMFINKGLREKGIETLKTAAKKAPIEDKSKPAIKMIFNPILDIAI